MKFHICLVIFLIILHDAYGKVFTRCELAQELKRQGFVDLRNWVCLVEAESGRNTSSLRGPKPNGSYDWGLFHINDGFNCKPGTIGGFCAVDCHSLIIEDITVASFCAKLIWNLSAWTTWEGWMTNCLDQPLPDLSLCDV